MHQCVTQHRAIFTILGLLFSVSLAPAAAGQEVLPQAEELTAPLSDTVRFPAQDSRQIDSTAAGWQEAGRGKTTGINIRANWVMVSQTGELPGTVLGEAIDAIPMDIIALKSGLVKSQTRTDRSGNFRLEGLSEGVYTIVGYSSAGFFTYGVNVVNYREGVPHMPRRLISNAVPFVNKNLVSELIQQHSPAVKFLEYGDYEFDQTSIDQAAHFGLAGLQQFDVEARPATSIGAQSIALAADGVMTGRIHQMHFKSGRPVAVPQTRVLLLEQGQVVAQTDCNRMGIFEFSGLPSGSFTLLAWGQHGFAVIEIQTTGGVGRDRPTGPSATSVMRVSTRKPALSATSFVDLSLAQPESVGWINHHLTEQQFLEARAQPRFRHQPVPCCQACMLPLIRVDLPCDCGH